MEEKKVTPRIGQREEVKETKENNEKFSYEQLNEICSQLYQENQNLVKRLQQMDISNMFRRLDYLFKVVECYNNGKDTPLCLSFDAEFVHQCLEEIQEAMTLPKEDKENKDGETE